jgi:hypothetical protein
MAAFEQLLDWYESWHLAIIADSGPFAPEQKRTLRPLALPFLEQLQIHLRDLLQYFLHLSERAQTFLHLLPQLAGDGDLAPLPIAETHGENPNRPVPLAFSQNRQPGLLQRTMRLSREPGNMVERSGICSRSCWREALSWVTLSFISS